MSDRIKVSIIGFGHMGHYYTQLLSPCFDISILSSKDIQPEVEAMGARYSHDFGSDISASNYIFITVPLRALDSIIPLINDHAQPKAVVIDCCSARIEAEERLAKLKCQHFGIHGGVITGQPDAIIIDYLANLGQYFKYLSPEEHDRKATTTGLAHFIAMVFDSYLMEDDKIELSEGTVGPLLSKIIDHMRINSLSTYQETQLVNPFMSERRKEFIKALIEYDLLLDSKEFPFGKQKI